MAGQEVSKARVAACDVHILVSFVRDSWKLPDPAVQVVENQEPQEVQEHDCMEKEQEL